MCSRSGFLSSSVAGMMLLVRVASYGATQRPVRTDDLGNMRANGVRAPLEVSCGNCHHRAIVWPDDVSVPSFGPRMVRTRCGIVGADARPNWKERPNRESLTVQRTLGNGLFSRTMSAPGGRRHTSHRTRVGF
jgi:hypothetical protein